MSHKVALGAGHGLHTAGKRTPDNEHEWSFNSKVVESAIAELAKYDVEVLRVDDPTGATDVPLSTRTNKANKWGADVYVSYHHNANTGKWGAWTGTETFTYLGKQPESEKLAKEVHSRVVKAYGLKDRGLKKENFHVVRETKMPAILVEGGYMDSTIDIKKLRSASVLKKAGQAVAQGIVAYLKLKKKVTVVKPASVSSADTYKVKNGDTLYGISSEFGISVKELKTLNGLKSDLINIGQVLKVKKSAQKPKDKLLTVIVSQLFTYNSANWNDKGITVKKGEVFTIKDELKVDGAKMYKLKSGLYITANPKYVSVK